MFHSSRTQRGTITQVSVVVIIHITYLLITTCYASSVAIAYINVPIRFLTFSTHHACTEVLVRYE